MKLPTLTAHPVSRDMISTFGGYHHHSTVPDNSFFDMENMSSDHYPALSVRKARDNFEGEVTSPYAMIYTDRLCYVDGSALVIGTERIECGLSTASSMLPKKLVSMGTYLIVFPDHYYVNTADTSDCGSIETRFSSYVSRTYCDYTIGYCDENGATATSGSGYFILNCSTNYTSEGESEWISNAGFRIGQTLKAEALSSDPEFSYHLGIPASEILTKTETIYVETENPMTGEIIRLPTGEKTLYAVKYYDISSAVVYALPDRAIIFKGTYREIVSEYTEKDLTAYDYGFALVGDPIPDMDYVFEHENRLWGCRYGRNVFGELVNEIYASSLGSFRDFGANEGVSTDAYVQGVGTDGPFTGACSLNGYPYFFKEKGYHKVYGSYPAQYQVQAVECKGVQQGSSSSMATINGVLYYKAIDCVCSFDGSYPTDISYSLGDCRYADAVGGSHRYKYYLSMRDIDTDEWSLFVYDARYDLWHREDALRAGCFCDTMRALYCIPEPGDRILDLTSGAGDEGALPWSFETGMIAAETVDRKFLQNLSVRLSLAVGGALFAFIEYDSSGQWEYLFRIAGTSTNTFTIPITPQRCDHFRLKFSGTGDMKLFALAKSYTKGSAY